MESEVGFRIAEQTRERLERAQELGQIEREAQQLSSSILILDQNIQAAVQVRDAKRQLELVNLERGNRALGVRPQGCDSDMTRQAARERWLEYRSGMELANGRERAHTQDADRQIVLEIDPDKSPIRGRRLEQEGLQFDLSS